MMLKKTISFVTMFTIVCGIMTTVHAQDDSRNKWEYIMLTPDNSNLKVLGDNMRKHNQKYHSEGPYRAYVFTVATGPNVGKIVWQMGPVSYTDLDSRPSDNGHDEDWRDNIMRYVKHQTDSEYWNTDANLSMLDEMDTNTVSHPILMIRFMNIERGKAAQVSGILTQLHEAVKAIDGHSPLGVFDNEFRQGAKGRHIAVVRYLKSWSELDGPNNFKSAFIKVHGEDSWDAYLGALDDTFSDYWDEIIQYNPHMSGQ